MSVKGVGYAFPTSSLAAKYGRAKEGCYYIETAKSDAHPGKAVKGPFATKEEAIAALPSVDGDVSRWCLSVFKTPVPCDGFNGAIN